jgi:hypothetical protein
LAYKKLWSREDVSFEVVAEDTEHPVVTVEVRVPGGVMLTMGEPEEVGRRLVAKRAHISSRGLAPNDVGISNLRLVAEVVMKEMDYDEIEVVGEIRTTGTNKGHRPRPFRFARGGVFVHRSRPEPGRND